MFSKRYRYRFGDIDHAGIAYYPALLHYFHCAFEDWWAEELGYPYATLLVVDQVGFPAVSIKADFLSPIRYGDEPEVAVAPRRIGRTSVTFGFWMSTPRARPACRADITTVAVDMRTMQKLPVPDRWRDEFARRLVAEDPV
jgi:YbgC/YbaW family acyl-CoA thioester hydrolase